MVKYRKNRKWVIKEMPRHAREKGESGIYHIVLRGINRQSIFQDDEDYQKFLGIIERVKNPDKFKLYGYCLMGNHVHLLLHEQKDEIATIMKRVGVSYARWYNRKYDRVGHVFQDRYKSEVVEDEGYLITLLRYIHNNPVKAQIVLEAEEYKWSSCKTYARGNGDPEGMTNTNFILGILSENEEIGRRSYEELMKHEPSDDFLDVERKVRKSDSDLYKEIEKILNGAPITELQTMEKKKRDELLRCIKQFEGVTQRQIARVTGINQSTVFKA
jgi:REP element-mobilizing transposase RayT